jgi:hypothetical protein
MRGQNGSAGDVVNVDERKGDLWVAKKQDLSLAEQPDNAAEHCLVTRPIDHGGTDNRYIELFLGVAPPDNAFGFDFGLSIEVSVCRDSGFDVFAHDPIMWRAAVHSDGTDMNQAAAACRGHGVANSFDGPDGVGNEVRPGSPLRNRRSSMEHDTGALKHARIQPFATEVAHFEVDI